MSETHSQPQAVILSDTVSPSIDYLVRPHLAGQGYDVVVADLSGLSAIPHCDMVVVARYVTAAGMALLQKLHRSGTRVVYFMDDDLFDLRALHGLPWRYRWKIVTTAWRHRHRLAKLCDEMWVSTPYLAEKYAYLHPDVLSPQPIMLSPDTNRRVRVCYHGTASHARELAWLEPVMRKVLARDTSIHFELFGGRDVAKLFRHLPRVNVLHPMSWSNYLAYTSSRRCEIALAPLLPGAFNAARGPTKFYDYTRHGAVGIYADVAPYQGFIRDDVDGVLLGEDEALWVETILALAADTRRRERLLQGARARVGQSPVEPA